MKFSETAEYLAAFQALQKIRATGNHPEEVRSLATMLLFMAGADCPPPLNLYKGIGDERDRQICRAFERAFQELITAEDLNDYDDRLLE